MSELTYAEKVQAQIAQYASTVNMHELPDAAHIWSQGYIAPGFLEVFGTGSINDAYALAFVEARRGTDESGASAILGIGSGDGAVEMAVAERILELGHRNFKLICTDISPIQIERLNKIAFERQMSQYVSARVLDLNTVHVDGHYDLIMANHSLHHIEALEHLFDFCHASLTAQGIFATCDIIGRNGHMRWPESAAVLKAIWPILSPKQRYHAQIGIYHQEFQDFDCSNEGFEGIRAQDVLPRLLDRFHPYKWFATGGFADLLVDRGYGHGFDVNDAYDKSLVRMICDLNELLLDAGVVTPTWMMAYFTKDDRGEHFYRDRRARYAVRSTETDPPWLRFYGPHE